MRNINDTAIGLFIYAKKNPTIPGRIVLEQKATQFLVLYYGSTMTVKWVPQMIYEGYDK